MYERITFANPAYPLSSCMLYLHDCFYVLNSKRHLHLLSMPGLQSFAEAGITFRHYLRHILFASRIIALTLLIIVLARPQATDKFQNISTEGIDIVLTLDISGSMLARDFRPDRLEASKNVATEFISGRPYDRIGLVVFSGEEFYTVPSDNRSCSS